MAITLGCAYNLQNLYTLLMKMKYPSPKIIISLHYKLESILLTFSYIVAYSTGFANVWFWFNVRYQDSGIVWLLKYLSKSQPDA